MAPSEDMADTDTALRIYNPEGEQVGFHDDVDYAADKGNSKLSFSPEAVEVRLHNGIAWDGEAEGDTFTGTDVVEYTDWYGGRLT